MKPETKLRILNAITATCAAMAMLGTLPVDSADLPMPENWRPYILSVGFAGTFISRFLACFIPILKPSPETTPTNDPKP